MTQEDTAQIRQIMEKIELAARRAVAIRYPDGITEKSLMREFADQVCKLIKDLPDGQ